MEHFSYKHGDAYCEDVALEKIAASVGTPAFVYSHATLQRHCDEFIKAFNGNETLACFAVKANSVLAILQQIFASGLGADIVSIGELERALLAGCNPKKIVFSGVGKRADEIARAIDAGILCFNVESIFELELIAQVASQFGKPTPIALRINPNIAAKTHPKIRTGLYSSKFGLSEKDLGTALATIKKHRELQLIGLACHIGSQIVDLKPLKQAAERMASLVAKLRKDGFTDLQFVNMGGGLGIRYQKERPPALAAYAKTLQKAIAPTGLKLIVEPGRVIAGNAGILLTRVIGTKQTPKTKFVVVDASMTELVRPAFYGAYHEILPQRRGSKKAKKSRYDVVGPVCETSDTLGENRLLPAPQADDLLWIRSCGSYGSTMASNYNSRPRPVEVLVSGDQFRTVKEREPLTRLWQLEHL